MEKVTELLVFVSLVVSLSAYPVDESYNSAKKDELKVSPASTEASYTDENDNDTSNSTEQGYIEETYIEVLLPGIPQLNSTQLESLLNSTANQTTDANKELSKRSADNEENSSKEIDDDSDVSNSTEQAYVEETFEGVFIPQLNLTQLQSILNSTTNLTTDSDNERSKRSAGNEEHKSSQNKDEVKAKSLSTSHAASHATYTAEKLNTRPVRDVTGEEHDGSSSKGSSEEKSSEEKNDSSSSEESSEEKSKPANRAAREAPEKKGAGNEEHKSSQNKDEVKEKSPSNSHAASPATYTAEKLNSRPVRDVTGEEHDDSSSKGLSEEKSSEEKNYSSSSEESSEEKSKPANRAAREAPEKKSDSSEHASPSTPKGNPRKVREADDSSEESSSSSTTKEPTVYITPQAESSAIPKETNPSTVGKDLKPTSEE